MKLSNIKVDKNNILHCAIHRKYGIVWSDGCKVYLTSLSPLEEYTSSSLSEVKIGATNTVLLGEFKKVDIVSWSDTSHPRSFLSVVYKQDFSPFLSALQIWQVTQIFPKVELSLILNQPLTDQPSHHGCLSWDLSVKKLCIVLKHSSQIYFYDADGGRFHLKGSLTPSVGTVECRCASWARDSKVLLIATYLTIALHESDHEGVNLFPYSMFNIAGCVCALAISGEAFLCSCELLLETFINNNAENKSYPVEKFPMCQGDCSPTYESNVFSAFHLLPSRNAEESSFLVVISQVGQVLSKINLQGILSPNLLLWLPFRNKIVVGSTHSKILNMIALQSGVLSKVNETLFPSHLRPKGIATTGESDDSTYLAVGDISSQAHLFPSPSDGTNMDVEIFVAPLALLTQKNVLFNVTNCEPNSMSEAGPSSSFMITSSDCKRDPVNTASSEAILNSITQNLLHKLEGLTVKEPLIVTEELKVLHNNEEHNHHGMGNSGKALHRVYNNKDVGKSHYSTLKETETILVTCEFTNANCLKCSDVTKQIMLLPGGRLKIKTLLDAFNIKNAEIYNGSVYSVMTSTEDGCIPVRFHNNEKIFIRGPLRM